MAERIHLFPSRTQKLSSLTPTIAGWQRPVKIGSCRIPLGDDGMRTTVRVPSHPYIFLGSSMAEHSAVNRRVVSSSLTRGANKKSPHAAGSFCCAKKADGMQANRWIPRWNRILSTDLPDASRLWQTTRVGWNAKWLCQRPFSHINAEVDKLMVLKFSFLLVIFVI